MQVANELRRCDTSLNYPGDREKIKRFLLFYTENGLCKYLDQLRGMRDTFILDMNDIAVFDDTGLAQRFEKHAFSYLQHTAQAIDEILYGDLNDGGLDVPHEQQDAFFQHRVAKFKERFPDRQITDVFPGMLLRNYTVILSPLIGSLARTRSIRDVGAEDIGQLVTVRGVVTRVSAVKPAVRVATYICGSCGAETYQQINTDAFDMLEECRSEKCRIRNVRGTLTLLSRGSKFIRMQTLLIQELTSDAPHGCVPRTLSVECYAGVTDRARPGEYVAVSGVFLPRPYHGFKKLRAGLLNDTYLLAMQIQQLQGQQESVGTLVDDSPIVSQTVPIELLVKSFAPEIFQMDEIKKVLLLMLVGAPSLQRSDGMRVRGDINVLLLGDPGVAKSQLLKTVIKISRRGVYATGKGSSGVGLTAAVGKDPVTGEMILEGGALVLSDGGVCCIDELDKMNENDRVAIHEVMEQQTVSISKAGINTTLNARCAVLAAANPVRGRYEAKKSLEQNSGLPCSLLSRFDVVCVLKDDADLEADAAMAEHVAGIHQAQEESVDGLLNYSQIRYFIGEARRVNPVLPVHLKERLVEAYMGFRHTGATPRTLLSLIRLSLAHARLRMVPEVGAVDVDEAVAVIERVHVLREKQEVETEKQRIFRFITSLVHTDGHRRWVDLSEVWSKTAYPQETVEGVIDSFETMGVWLRGDDVLEMID